MLRFFETDPTALEAFCVQQGMQKFVAAQLLDWVYRKNVVDPALMSNLSKRSREMVAEQVVFDRGVELARQEATDGTQKLLIGWPDEETKTREAASGGLNVLNEGGANAERSTECVMIPTEDRKTACVSSQVGCPVGCRFCASGLGGLEGNLAAGQIVEQVHRLGRLRDVGRITNVVFMGMGEPLANMANVLSAIRTIHAPWGLGISARRITISTVGLPAAIRKLVGFELPVTLALSLHAPNDELRRNLIPWAQYTTIAELLDACDEYFQATGREITLEYILLGGVNDQLEHARELAEVAKRLRANVNLIRYNEVRGLPFDRPHTQDVHRFQAELRRKRVNAHIRASRGRDIAAACGQLRKERQAAG